MQTHIAVPDDTDHFTGVGAVRHTLHEPADEDLSTSVSERSESQSPHDGAETAGHKRFPRTCFLLTAAKMGSVPSESYG